jgi:predicted permease
VSVILRPRRFGSVLTDLRYAVRLFRRHPALVGTTAIGLSLAIGVATAVFGVVNAAAFRPYDMDDPATVVKVQQLIEDGMSTTWPYSAFRELQDHATLATVEASLQEGVEFSLSRDDERGQARSVAVVSSGYLPMLGGRALIGRTLGPSDDQAGAPPVAVLNHVFWTRRLNADPSIVGRTVWLSGSPVTIVGVLKPRFSGPVDNPPALWLPFAAYDDVYKGHRPIDRASTMGVQVIARTSAVATRASAEAQLSAAAIALPRMGSSDGDTQTHKVTGVALEGAASRIDGPDAVDNYIVFVIVFVILGLVLALACANVANMLLAGASTRAREIGVRLAMGATRGRIVRQLVSESMLIGAASGALGFLIALWIVPVLAALTGLPDTYDLRPDWAVGIFATAVGILSGIGAGLAPARHGAAGDVSGVLKGQSLQSGSSPKASRTRRWFVGFQAASSMLLLVVAALFTRAALHITHVDLGFDAAKLVSVSVRYPDTGFDDNAARAYWQNAAERVGALPGVERTSLALYPPFGGAVEVTELKRRGRAYSIYTNHTDSAYFETAGFRIVRGRGFSDEESTGNAPVALVSENLVRDFLGDKDPIGAPLSDVVQSAKGVTIIGVVADAVTARVRGDGNGTIYRPIDPRALIAARLMVRTNRPQSAAHSIEMAMASIDPRMRATSSIVSTDVDRFLNEPRILATLSTALAALALVLAVVGLYGVTAFIVSQRSQEMSVRMAIGASSGDVVRLLVRDSMRPVATGLVIGLVLALLGSRVLSAALSGLSPYDPLAITAAIGVLAASAMLAVVLPARRAAHADPASVLRQQ